MARPASVVLSPADKKAKIVALKAEIKDLKNTQKAANTEIKMQTKIVTAAEKQLAKLQGGLEKLTTKVA